MYTYIHSEYYSSLNPVNMRFSNQYYESLIDILDDNRLYPRRDIYSLYLFAISCFVRQHTCARVGLLKPQKLPHQTQSVIWI